MYAFVDDKGGKNPEGPLVNIGGLLYGTAYSGGHGFGTIFKLDPATGTETLATKFQGGALGANPASGLFVDGAGAIYETRFMVARQTQAQFSNSTAIPATSMLYIPSPGVPAAAIHLPPWSN